MEFKLENVKYSYNGDTVKNGDEGYFGKSLNELAKHVQQEDQRYYGAVSVEHGDADDYDCDDIFDYFYPVQRKLYRPWTEKELVFLVCKSLAFHSQFILCTDGEEYYSIRGIRCTERPTQLLVGNRWYTAQALFDKKNYTYDGHRCGKLIKNEKL